MSETKLDSLQRLEIISELELKTAFHIQYLRSLSDAKLVELLKERG